MTIYLDVLIVINLFVTYFLLLSTKLILRHTVRRRRMLAGAVLGAFSSLVILFPALHPLILTAVKLLMALLICCVTFGLRPWRLLVKSTLAFYGINFIYAGCMMALWYFVSPPGMRYHNGTAYFNISAVVLMGSTVIAYLIIQLTSFLLKKAPAQAQRYDVEIECNGNAVLVKAFLDTGNHLSDIITGLPVAVCELNALNDLLPPDIYSILAGHEIELIDHAYWKKRVRMIPVHAVTGQSLVPCFKPDRAYIIQGEKRLQKEMMVAVSTKKLSDGEFSMLIGESLVQT